jgi:hypothetical protein
VKDLVLLISAIAFTLRLPASGESPALVRLAFCRDDFAIYSNLFAMATVDMSGVDRLRLPLSPLSLNRICLRIYQRTVYLKQPALNPICLRIYHPTT